MSTAPHFRSCADSAEVWWLSALEPPDADASEVAETVARVVDMPFGRRPFRVHIDPSQDGAEIVNGVNYASANAAARAFIKPEILSNPAIYPGDELLKKCEMMEDLGPATTVMDRYWTEIKAQ